MVAVLHQWSCATESALINLWQGRTLTVQTRCALYWSRRVKDVTLNAQAHSDAMQDHPCRMRGLYTMYGPASGCYCVVRPQHQQICWPLHHKDTTASAVWSIHSVIMNSEDRLAPLNLQHSCMCVTITFCHLISMVKLQSSILMWFPHLVFYGMLQCIAITSLWRQWQYVVPVL